MSTTPRQNAAAADKRSVAIKICRVLCIFFMSYVHVNPGRDSWKGEVPKHLSDLGFILADVMGRASVPALSVLSGYLAVAAYGRRPSWWAYATERWQVMVIPMITWNLVIVLLSLLVFWFAGIQTGVFQHLLPLDQISAALILDRLTGYNYGSATSALNFLRDLFVCSLLLPLLNPFVTRLGVAGVGIVWVAGLTVGFWPIVMRPHVLMFFAAGVYLARGTDPLLPWAPAVAKLLCALLLALGLVFAVPVLQLSGGTDLPGTVLRLVVAASFLTAAVVLSGTWLGGLIARLEPVTYLFYLAHVVVILILWGAWQQLFGTDLASPYAAFFVAAPLATMVLLVGAHKALATMPLWVQKVFVGKTVSP